MAKTKKNWKSSQLEEGMCFKCGEYTDKIVKNDGRCIYCWEKDEMPDDKDNAKKM